MQENGSVLANGEPSELSAQWRMHMTETGHRLENVEYANHYLMVVSHENGSALIGRTLKKQLTRNNYMEFSATEQSEEASGSGSGEGETNMTSPEQDGDFSVIIDWLIIRPSPLSTVLRFSLQPDVNCYLAFNGAGFPVDDMCTVSPDSESASITFLSIFNGFYK